MMVKNFFWLIASILLVQSSIAFTTSSSSRSHVAVDHRTGKRIKTDPIRRTQTQLQLSPSSVFSAVASPLGSLVVLAGVVLVHEGGHYLAAKSFGITVEEFSVGVGPKLFGFATDKEDFSLRAVPLGGYVKFPENYNSTLVRQQELKAIEEGRKARRKQRVPERNRFSVDWFGKKKEKKQKSRSNSWFRPFRKQPERKPKSASEVEIDYYTDPNLLQNRPWPQRAAVLSGGIMFNFLLAFLCFFGEVTVGNGLRRPVLETGAVVTSLRPSSASQGLLQPGDVIVGMNGMPTRHSSSVSESQRAISDLIAAIRSTPLGDAVTLQVNRPTQKEQLNVIVQPKPVVVNSPQGDLGPQSLGVMLAPNYIKTELIHATSIVNGVVLASRAVGQLTQDTADSLAAFFSQLLSSKSPSVGQISGPIGLIRTGSEVVATNDLSAVVTFAAAVSVNLAVINSLPLPALDGGQLVFVAAEAITRKKIDQKLQEGITAATLLFLLVVSVGTAVGDVESLFSR